MSRFSTAYERFIKSPSAVAAFEISNATTDLYAAVDALRVAAALGSDALITKENVAENEADIELIFSSTPTVAEFAIKLEALAELYNKLCSIFEVSSAVYPLRIVKIETGSWYAKLVGSSGIISLLPRLIEAAFGYLYRKYTTEGKLSALPRAADAAERILGLKEKATALGLDTKQMDRDLEHSLAVIAGNLDTLLTRETSIVLNRVSLGDGRSRGNLPEPLRDRDSPLPLPESHAN